MLVDDLITSRMRSSAYIGSECRKGSCSRLQRRLTGHCTMMPLSSHQSPTSRLDKDFGVASTSDDLCVPAVRLAIVGRRAFSVAGARVWNALPAEVTSAPSLFTFRKRLKLHLFSLSYPGLVY